MSENVWECVCVRTRDPRRDFTFTLALVLEWDRTRMKKIKVRVREREWERERKNTYVRRKLMQVPRHCSQQHHSLMSQFAWGLVRAHANITTFPILKEWWEQCLSVYNYGAPSACRWQQWSHILPLAFSSAGQNVNWLKQPSSHLG